MRRGTLLTAITWVIALTLGVATARAQSVQPVPFGGQPYGAPYFVTGGAGDASRVYVVEAQGQIDLVRDGVTQPTPFLDITPDVLAGGERGLFSMALSPDYATSGLFYVFYTRDVLAPGSEHSLIIEEFRRSTSNPEVADPASRRIVLEIPHLTAGNHNGGQLQFGPDGYLYIATGDGGNTANEAQNLAGRLGKLLRIDPRGAAPFQYSIPPDNPFADGGGPNADEIYSYGLRNPYRFSFDRYTGDLIIGDVGEGSHEEINFKAEGNGRGANFGWPCFEGPDVFSTSGTCASPINHSPPVFRYRTGMGIGGGAAVNAGYVIRDPALPALNGRFEWTDTYGDLPGVRTVLLSEGGSLGDASLGFNPDGLVFTSGQDACGHIYIGQSGSGGLVTRLEPTSGPFPCKTTPEMTASVSGPLAVKRRGAIPVSVTCDVDCTAFVTGSVVLKLGKRKFKTMKATAVTRRVQLGPPNELLLPLSRKQRRALKKSIKRGQIVRVNAAVAATGAGGGTANAADDAVLKRNKKRKKRGKR